MRFVLKILSSFGIISSGPLGFLEFKLFNWSLTSCSVIKIELRVKLGNSKFSVISFSFSVVDIVTKWLFKTCALSNR